MSVATTAASRLLCRSLAANSAKTSSRARASTTSTTTSIPPSPRHPQQRRPFHTTPPALSRSRANRSPFRSISAKEMGLLNPDKAPAALEKYKALTSPDYDDTDIEILQRKYTPEQLAALVAGERVVSAEDMATQGRMRNDPYQLEYLTDFRTLQPTLDRRESSGRAVDTGARFMTPDEFGDDFLEWIREQSVKAGAKQDLFTMTEALAMYEEMRSKKLSKDVGEPLTAEEAGEVIDKVLGPEEPVNGLKEEMVAAEFAAEISDPSSADAAKEVDAKDQAGKRKKKKETGPNAGLKNDTLEIYKYLTERNAMTGFDGGDSALAPGLPADLPGVKGLYSKGTEEEDMSLDPEGSYSELRRKTGLSTKEIIDIFSSSSKILVRRYVSNQTRLGKIRSTYVLAIAGNKAGRLGLGEAKSVDSETASLKARTAAIMNMQPIRRYENRTIYGDVQGKSGGTVVQLFTRPPGFGLRVSHRFFEMARAVGISDLSAKMPRSRNPMNSVKACFHALMNQPDPEKIALGRGQKLVDARKVYYGGATL